METPYGVYKRLQRRDRGGGPRFLTSSCFHDLPLFRSDDAKSVFVEALAWVRERYDLLLWAWVVMETHTHVILVRRESDPPIREIGGQLKARVASRVLRLIRNADPALLAQLRDSQDKERLWQRGGGHDRNLVTGRAIWNAIEYIHNNPVEAGICRAATDWPWSSARTYAARSNEPIPIDFGTIPGPE